MLAELKSTFHERAEKRRTINEIFVIDQMKQESDIIDPISEIPRCGGLIGDLWTLVSSKEERRHE